MSPQEMTPREDLSDWIKDKGSWRDDVRPEEKEFLSMAVNDETEKMGNWLERHADLDSKAHFWLSTGNERIARRPSEIAFELALGAGSVAALRCLHEKGGVNLNKPVRTDGQAYLHRIVLGPPDRIAQRKMILTLLEMGADPEAKTLSGHTAAAIAESKGLGDLAALIRSWDHDRKESIEAAHKTRHAHNIAALDRLLKKRPKP